MLMRCEAEYVVQCRSSRLFMLDNVESGTH